MKAAQQQKPKDRVVIAFIHPGQCSAYFTTSLVGTLLYDRAKGRHIVGLLNEWSSANVSMPRNSLTRQFVDDYDAEWLLWIDADMAWEAFALEQLLAVADPVKAPIMGGLCFGAAEDKLFPTIYQMALVDDKPMTMRLHNYPDDTIMQVAATGAAFLLIHRSALLKMRDRQFNPVFTWFQETQLGDRPAGEDITFCLRAGMCDIPIHVHTGVKIGHHKSRLLTADVFREQTKEAVPDDGDAAH